MSFTEWASAEPGNHTNGIPRRSAYRICLPNLSAFGATSVLMPRERRAAATVSDTARVSSSVTATSTQVGTDRLAVTSPRPTSTPISRLTPSEMPTPGYVDLPSLASAS